MRTNISPTRWAKYALCGLSLLCGSPVLANGLNGPQFRGPEVNIDGTLGIRCGARAGDSAGVYIQGGVRDGNDPTAMIGVMIPFHPNTGNCRAILSYEEAMGRLLIAEGLLERGLITPEEYKNIADEVHEVIKSR